jgi:hypothetical protein
MILIVIGLHEVRRAMISNQRYVEFGQFSGTTASPQLYMAVKTIL